MEIAVTNPRRIAYETPPTQHHRHPFTATYHHRRRSRTITTTDVRVPPSFFLHNSRNNPKVIISAFDTATSPLGYAPRRVHLDLLEDGVSPLSSSRLLIKRC
ncbi:unnamed protein product [Lactuca virosa]|uniref:Uncharacterized protein n=1 Tax=Lactuca virosa TaxID=75947 RepID=A0AAU9MIK0_9ASTR|nr:unnamed protein product [Lactuca virosa]